MSIRSIRNLLLGSVAAVVLTACSSSNDPQPLNIVETAQSDPRFSTLVEAVVAADLAGTLSGPGPFTVFAPTNEAFAALLADLGVSKEQLFADSALLTSVLTYHVLPARVGQAQIPAGRPITTVQGSIFKIEPAGADLVITDGRNRTARILAADIGASNGVIHAIDRVILPPDRNIVETAMSLPDFSLLVEAVVAANLQDALAATGPLTVFAPTNEAFAALLEELGTTKEALFANTALLTQVLTYHVLDGRVLKAEVPVGTPIPTLQNQTFSVDTALNIVDALGRTASIVATDVFTSNGVIHVIDRVLLPQLD
jgi:uncharacterized surface protein with fasciclin (FAS1) repeats